MQAIHKNIHSNKNGMALWKAAAEVDMIKLEMNFNADIYENEPTDEALAYAIRDVEILEALCQKYSNNAHFLQSHHPY